MPLAKKIYQDFINKVLDKKSAIEQLISLIENSNNNTLREESIQLIGEIDKGGKMTFNFLENLLISDLNPRVRKSAALVLSQNFTDKSIEPMKWALKNEEDPFTLKIVYDTFIKMINYLGKIDDYHGTLLKEIEDIEEKEFKIEFEILQEENAEINNQELSEVLINYYTLDYLKKSFWRLKYKAEKCLVLELNFIFKGLTHIPEAIENLVFLKKLILRYNQLMSLPQWIGSLESLEYLNLNVNNITEIPSSIGKLTSLRELSFWKNEIETIPDSIGSLLELQILNIRLNKLIKLPNSIGNLSALKELNLHDNKLVLLPETIGSLSSLETLNLSWNSLTNLPSTIGSLKELRILDLERNELQSIPEEIGSLSRLEELNLGDNQLRTIPDSLGSLKSLYSLNLSRNELKSIPDSLGALTNLRELFLGENKGVKIPRPLKKLQETGLEIRE